MINDNGGEYRANLTKDVTHLIAKQPAGQKYKYAMTWEIKTVAVEWLEQSLERGMILEEGLFNLLLPEQERGRDAWIRKTTSSVSLGKRDRDDDLAPQNARKLRRTASARLECHNDGLWTDIVAREAKTEGVEHNAWDDESAERKFERETTTPKASNAEGPGAPEIPEKNSSLQRSQSMTTVESLLGKQLQKQAIFTGKAFLLWGFDERKTSILEGHLRSHGANIVSDCSQLESFPNSSYLLVPHTTSRSDAPVMSNINHKPGMVTDLWVERCLYLKYLEDPFAKVTSTPFYRFPIAGFESMRVCSTAFQGIDLLHVSKAVKLMGANYDEFFTREASVLVCNTVNLSQEKLRHAQLWDVPAVSAAWLWDSVKSGERLPFEKYLAQSVSISTSKVSNPTDIIQSDSSTKAQINDTSARTSSSSTKRPTQKSQVIEDRYKPSKKGTLASTKPQQSTADLFPDSAGPSVDILPDDDTLQPTDFIAPLDSSNTFNSTSISAPLREITPNSSPPKLIPESIQENPPKPPQTKAPTPSPQKEEIQEQEDTLGPAISSLLAHQRSSRTTAAAKNPASANPSTNAPHRRRRQLLGRAPSNLSSTHSIPVSRASSVDTLNTDGLGTPLELSNNNTVKAPANNPTTTTTAKEPKPQREIYDPEDEAEEWREDPLQMTQLSVEDPNVAAWRERVAFKMAGGKITGKEGVMPAGRGGATPGRKRGGAAATAAGAASRQGGWGIAKRTRQAVG